MWRSVEIRVMLKFRAILLFEGISDWQMTTSNRALMKRRVASISGRCAGLPLPNNLIYVIPEPPLAFTLLQEDLILDS